MVRDRKVMSALEISLSDIVRQLDDHDPLVRESAAMYCAVLGEKAVAAQDALIVHSEDPDITVRMSIAEALYLIGERQCCLRVINQALLNESPVIRVQALQLLESFGYNVTSARRLTTTSS